CDKTVEVKKSKSCEADVSVELRKEVENLYKLSLPEDFYHFWKFCEELDPEEPADALATSLGLRLVGPYDILAGKHRMKTKSTGLNCNLHWRFYYDPPEFQTIIIGDNRTQYHMGYFRDSPDELPVYVGTNEAKKNCIIIQNGDNVFAAIKICKAIVEAANDEERLKAFAPIQEMMTFVQFANDECDYGMGLELGMDLFCYGSHYFHKVAGQLLPLAYNLLKRDLFAKIIEDHLASRSPSMVPGGNGGDFNGLDSR
ncbi:hypothetical protein A6R68_09321, partial [Neotoma lepida]